MIESLLEQYFLGNNNKETLTKEMMLLLEIKKKLEEFEKWKAEVLPKLKELEEKLKEKQEEVESKDSSQLIRKLREQVFDDLVDLLNSRRVNPAHAIKTRLHVFATENGITFPEAKKLFLRAFPEREDELRNLVS